MIFVNFDTFERESRIMIMSEDGKTVEDAHVNSDIKDIAETVVRSAHQHGTYTVKVHAPAVFYSKLNELVRAEESRLYTSNQILMENV